jgi:hypothetical protein
VGRHLVFLGLLALAVLAPTASAATLPCSRDAVGEVLRQASGRFAEVVDNGGGVGQLVCADLTGDGTRDALYTLDSGGTGRAFDWGLVVADGDAPRSATAGGGGSKLAIDVLNGRAEVANPIYRANDPNCCPRGGARIRTFRWNGTRLALAATRRTRTIPARFSG